MTTPACHANLPKLAFTINEFCSSTGIGRTRIYELIAAGSLRTVKLGRSRLVPADAANEFMASLPSDPRRAA